MYVISMTNSDRRVRQNAHLIDCRLNWAFFDALPSLEGSDCKYDEQGAFVHRGRKLTPGELGCFGSHVRLLRNFVRQNEYDWVLVIEDDVIIDKNYRYEHLIRLLERLDINYFRLFSRTIVPYKLLGWYNERQLLRFLVSPLGTQAYLISKRGASKFLASIDRMTRPIDVEFDRFWSNGLPAYTIFPFPTLELDTGSTIMKPAVDLSKLNGSLRLARMVWRSAEKMRRFVCNAGLRTRDRQIGRILLEHDHI